MKTPPFICTPGICDFTVTVFNLMGALLLLKYFLARRKEMSKRWSKEGKTLSFGNIEQKT